jgi:Dolichyl-phosphate-mannose-protein mannosyltransferase
MPDKNEAIALPDISTQQKSRSIAEAIADFLSRHDRASITFLLGFYASCALLAARTKPLWFDEMGTFIVATQPTLHQMLVSEPPDGQPPLYYLAARLSTHLFGQNAHALRLPALTAFLIAVYCVYLFVRRSAASLYGMLAAATLCVNIAAGYSMEARPYAFLLATSGLALVFWQSAVINAEGQPKSRLPVLAGLAIAVALAVLSHAYGVFYVGIPLALGELVRTWQRRRLDLPILAATLFGFTALVITIPIMHRSHLALFAELGTKRVAVAEPTIHRLLLDFKAILDSSQVRLVALLAFLGLCLPRLKQDLPKLRVARDPGSERPTESAPTLPSLPEAAAVMGLSILLPLAWLFSRYVTHYYYWRYGIGSALGLAVLTAWLVSTLAFRKGIAVALLLAAGPALLIPAFMGVFGPQPALDRSSLMDRGDPRLDIVMASALQFPSVWFYSKPGLRQRLHYIADRRLRDALNDPIPEITLAGHDLRHSLPMPIDSLQPFLASHPSFLLYASEDGADREWLPAELRRRGYALTLVATQLYDHPDELFLATAPRVTASASANSP